MLERFLPSRLIAPLVPAFAQARWGAQIDKGIAVADTIFVASDEKALTQRTALIAFSIRIASALIAYISQVLLARWLGSYEYGIFVWVWVAAVILGGLACLGFPSAVVRFIPQYRSSGEDSLLKGIVFGSRFYSFVTATLFAIVGIAGTWFFAESVSNIYVIPFYLGAICLPMLALADVQDGVARSFNWISVALSPTYLVRPCLILAAMALALVLGFEATAATALMATIFATWVTSTGQMLLINHRLKAIIPSTRRKTQPRIWIAVALPILLVEGFFALLTNVDILIAGMYLEPQEVAVYFAAVKTLALVHFVYFAVKAGAAHRYSQYFDAGDQHQYRTFVHETVRWTFWPSLAMGIVLLITGKYLLMLFGSDFASGYPLLFILVVGIIARASVGPAESVLNMSGQQNVCAMVYGVTLLVNILLNISLIPQYGLYGAAWATTIAMIFEAAALYSITRRRLDLHMFVFGGASSLHPTEEAG